MNNKEIMEKISELEQQIAELKTVKNIGILHHTESM